MIKVMAILLAVMMLAGYNFQTPAGGGDSSTSLRFAQNDKCGIGTPAYHEPACGIGEAAEHVPGGMNE